MGIAQLKDRFEYLEDKVEEEGGISYIKESPEWEKIGGEIAEQVELFDIYLHKSNYFKAMAHKHDGEVTKIEVTFTKPKHHFMENEPLPPIYEEGDREEYRQYHYGDKEE